ncbi:4-hydroxybenzoate octaprenyltransferase [Vibrio sp. 188UL20-2]|uniref:4-hydroxybenzoate octaprenyltransferase n=2 Tax=Vibrio ulleungensis TaxID=2807619 RepID=A0ABS2HNL9_9VIBR|nr:4-hydroxybenzoate octaprenyltransferase [Vibrio ulleungensis]MBM7038659.1 4-hydroxybenzoate octaprenyltransferase [Vibrio ulleungensis]
MNEKLSAYAQLMRIDKPIGILLLLWPTYWALFLAADGLPDLKVWAVFTAGVVLMRSAGCVINDFADRHFDGHVERTKLRPIPAGKVSAREAVILFIVLCIVSFALVLTMNETTIKYSFIGVLLAFIYPFMKRFTHLPQLFLGLAFSWSIPMAWVAQGAEPTLVLWALFIANVLWTVAYDTQYAMVDRDDDVKIGIRSTAILFGRRDKMAVAALQFATLLILLWIGYIEQLGGVFYWSLLVSGALMVYQQWLIKARERQACFKAFLNNNYVGLAIAMGIAIAETV